MAQNVFLSHFNFFKNNINSKNLKKRQREETTLVKKELMKIHTIK